MELELRRVFKGENYSIGKLFIDGAYFCDTLEDTVRAKSIKVAGRTAIAMGKYRIIINYSPKFKKFMPLLCGVANFEGVRIHAGNTADDTDGCILVGQNKVVSKLQNSQDTYSRFYKTLYIATTQGEELWINIK